MNVSGHEIRIDGRLIKIGRLEGDKYKYLDEPASLLDEIKISKTRIDLFTFLQRTGDPSPQFPYPMEWDNLAVLPVSTFDHWWTKQITSVPRNRARQAEKKGLIVREADFDDRLVQGICDIYNESPIRQGKRFQHYGKDLRTVEAMSATFLDTSVFLGAFLDGKLIGFAKLVADDSWTQANLMHIVSMHGYKDKAPTNALVAQAVKSCATRNIRYLVYQNYSYGAKSHDGLSRFKEANGFRRMAVPRYFVPLNPIGSAALRLGLHNDLSARVPEPLLAKLRKFRAAWYQRKYPALVDAL